MIEITYVHTRVRITDYIYDVTFDGETVAAACSYHAAELVAQDVEARQHLLAMIADAVKQARQQVESVEQLACYVCGASAPHYYINHGPLCSYHYSRWLEWKEAQEDTPPQVEQAQAEQGAECPCGAQALYFTQYADRVYAYCPECWQEFGTPTLANPPLLAQCASVIRRCLGRTSGPEGIIDELRRVEAQLSKDGW